MFLNKILCKQSKMEQEVGKPYFLFLLLIINKAKTATKQLNTPIHKTGSMMIHSC